MSSHIKASSLKRLIRKPWSEVQIPVCTLPVRSMEGSWRSTAHQHRGKELGSVRALNWELLPSLSGSFLSLIKPLSLSGLHLYKKWGYVIRSPLPIWLSSAHVAEAYASLTKRQVRSEGYCQNVAHQGKVIFAHLSRSVS